MEAVHVLIDCDTCAVRGLACGDCVVTVLLAMPTVDDKPIGAPAMGVPAASVMPAMPVELDDAEQAAIAVLAELGLVPPLRLVVGG
jgi:hypothetical protein